MPEAAGDHTGWLQFTHNQQKCGNCETSGDWKTAHGLLRLFLLPHLELGINTMKARLQLACCSSRVKEIFFFFRLDQRLETFSRTTRETNTYCSMMENIMQYMPVYQIEYLFSNILHHIESVNYLYIF